MSMQGIGMTSQRTRERLIQRLADKGIQDIRVLNAMRQVPRHVFVDEALASRAYEDSSLPIGSGQTISQPYIVARMTELVMANEPKRVLEVGTGCGYQTAVLACLVRELYSIERVQALATRARETLAQLQLQHVRLRYGDGYAGWPDQAPFDAIIVTAAPPQIPRPLLEQLAEGGQLILPVGGSDEQELVSIRRQNGEFIQQIHEQVVFVPMLHGMAG